MCTMGFGAAPMEGRGNIGISPVGSRVALSEIPSSRHAPDGRCVAFKVAESKAQCDLLRQLFDYVP